MTKRSDEHKELIESGLDNYIAQTEQDLHNLRNIKNKELKKTISINIDQQILQNILCEDDEDEDDKQRIDEFLEGELGDSAKSKRAVYMFKEINDCGSDTYDDLEEYKDDAERKCPQLNEKNRTSEVLYVGSVTGIKIKDRMKEHLGCGSPSTSALHLKHWYEGKCEITIFIFDDRISPSGIRAIERKFQDQYEPKFGKKASQ